MHSEVEWSYFHDNALLVSVISLDWKRVVPDVDALEHGLCYENDDEPHIYFSTECLVIAEGKLVLDKDAYLYVYAEDELLGSGALKNTQRLEVDLSAGVSKLVSEALMAIASDPDDDAILQLIVAQPDPDGYVNAVNNAELRQVMQGRWVQNKRAQENIQLAGVVR